jgi:hypothetical protein
MNGLPFLCGLFQALILEGGTVKNVQYFSDQELGWKWRRDFLVLGLKIRIFRGMNIPLAD